MIRQNDTETSTERYRNSQEIQYTAHLLNNNILKANSSPLTVAIDAAVTSQAHCSNAKMLASSAEHP